MSKLSKVEIAVFHQRATNEGMDILALPYLGFVFVAPLRLGQQFLQLHERVLQRVHLVHQVVLLVVQLRVGHHGFTILLLHFG